MKDNKIPLANSRLVLREESDDWALLFDPETGETFSLNPVGVFIWKHLNGQNSIDRIMDILHEKCKNVPADAHKHIKRFIAELIDKGFVNYNTL
jgi:SynChlorMet cassette protein ScmD